MFDVLIIGGGVIGGATAYELSKYRLSVGLLEKENDLSLGTTRANSAIIHAGYDPEPGTLMAKTNVEGTAVTAQLCKKLCVHYKNVGSLVIAFNEEEVKHLEILLERGKTNGVPDMVILNQKELREKEPFVSKEAIAALYAPSAGIVNPWEYALRLGETAALNGVEVFLGAEVTDIKQTGSGFIVTTAGGKDYETKTVVNAAGVHADLVHNMVAKPSYKTMPNRGEYYLLDKSECEKVRHVIFQCPTEQGKGVLVAPTVHGNVVVGPNAEDITDGDNTSTTMAGLSAVSVGAFKSVPEIKLNQSIRNFAGVRAVVDHDDFIVQQAEDIKGFFDVAGIKSPGLSAAPAIATMVVGLVKDFGIKLEEKPSYQYLKPKVRLADLSVEERKKLVEENPEYGRIICRCETVTEGEILDAFDSPIPPVSIDGVKRRAMAGMGRCQGGFCGPRVVDVLMEKRGIVPEEILQDKAGTFIITGRTKGAKQ